jgi:TRAP-type C4-dicarboxylate transport system permease small subunit
VNWPTTPGSAPPGDDALGRAERFGRWLENALLGIVLGSMILLAASQVLLRVLFSSGVPFGDEGLRLLVLWAAMLGAVAASRDDVHLRIDLLSRFLPPAGRDAAAILVDLFTAAVAGVLAWYSWRFVAESREFGDQLLGSLPAWPFEAVLPAAFVLISYRYLILLARRVGVVLRRRPHP